MHLESKTHISPVPAIESPGAQWLGHPTRSRRDVASNPIWGSDFSEFEFKQRYNSSFNDVASIVDRKVNQRSFGDDADVIEIANFALCFACISSVNLLTRISALRTFAPFAIAHPYSARKFTCHVMH